MRTTAPRECIFRCYVLILFRLNHDGDNFMQSLKRGVLLLFHKEHWSGAYDAMA